MTTVAVTGATGKTGRVVVADLVEHGIGVRAVDIDVSPAQRALYDALLERLERRGYRVALACMTLPNDASARLHATVGFQDAGSQRRVAYKHGAWHDIAWLQRPIGAPADPPAEPR